LTEHPLDADSALEPAGPGRWRGAIAERWWVVRGPFGGYVSALLMRAMIAAVGEPARLPRSLTVHFVAVPEAGPFEAVATVERAGRSASTVSLRLEQGGRPIALALGACALWREDEPEWADGEPPAAPPPEACRPVERVDGMPPFFDQLDIRWVSGGGVGAVGEGRNVTWLRPRPPRALDHLALTMLSDGWMPAAFSKLGRPMAAPTLDLTIHFRAPLDTAEGWVLAVYGTRFSAGGTWEEDGELWSADGRLLAQSRQLAMIRV
jgi:acyl-CoA thioesterase